MEETGLPEQRNSITKVTGEQLRLLTSSLLSLYPVLFFCLAISQRSESQLRNYLNTELPLFINNASTIQRYST